MARMTTPAPYPLTCTVRDAARLSVAPMMDWTDSTFF